jgi:hypothetical protein
MQDGNTKLKIHGQDYRTLDLEFACVIFALKIWEHCLYRESCDIFTPHKSLKYLFTHEFHFRQSWWLELIEECGLSILYNLGRENVIPYALSRMFFSPTIDYLVTVFKGWPYHIDLRCGT